MFATGSLGDYLGMPTRKSYYASSANVTSTISSCSTAKFYSPLKIQRYTNANMRFDILNDVNRDYASHGLLVGITPGNSVLRTWEFNIPISSKDSTVSVHIPLGNMINVFGNQGPDQDGISFFVLLPSSIMPEQKRRMESAIYSLTFKTRRKEPI